MSSFDIGLQFLDADRMTYWGKRRTLLSKSDFRPDAGEAVYFDVTGNATPDSMPLGSINRARRYGEVASRKARMCTGGTCEP